MTPTPTMMNQPTAAQALTDVDKVNLSNEIRSQMAELSRKLEALGLGTGTPANRRQPAADGGPRSNAHLTLKTHMLATMEVRLKNLPGKPVALITRSRYDPDLHEKVDVRRKRSQLDDTDQGEGDVHVDADEGDDAPEIPAIKVGKEKRDQLLTMTIPMLRAMPEVAVMAEVPDKKEQLVDAILKMRDALMGLS